MQDFIIRVVLVLKKIFPPRNFKEDNCAKILIAGGYGYQNTGDEAQLAQSLRILSEEFPSYKSKVLTPNPQYTKEFHNCETLLASRTAVFNHCRKGNCFDFINPSRKFKFFAKALWTLANALLLKYKLPVPFLDNDSYNLLKELQSSSLLFFCGGGYLTGDTLSRLYDGIFLMHLAQIFNIPVVLSGQTIGIWKNPFNEYLARIFKKAKILTTRDPESSLEELKKIGIEGEHVFCTHDDALYCEKSSESYFEAPYTVLNFHYWGIRYKAEKEALLEQIEKIVNTLPKDLKVIFLPMIPQDMEAFEDFSKKYGESKITPFIYDYDFKKARKLIADSRFCITMKHHPIIFAMGENVPVINITYAGYYIHKNYGALKLFSQEKAFINLQEEGFEEKFNTLCDYTLTHREEISEQIKTSKQNLFKADKKFLALLHKLLDSYSSPSI